MAIKVYSWHVIYPTTAPTMGSSGLNNPHCPACKNKLPWGYTLKTLLGPARPNRAVWGLACPECQAQTKVPNSRVLLIAASGVFFGSQTSTMLVLREMSTTEFWLAKLWLIVGFYLIATFFLLKLELLDES